MELHRLPLRIQRGTDVERVEEGGGEDEQRRFRKVTAGADPVRSLGEYRARAGVGRLRTCGQNQTLRLAGPVMMDSPDIAQAGSFPGQCSPWSSP